MSNTTTSINGSPQIIFADVVIVGAGFGGCYTLHHMRKLGYSAKVIESAGDFGGVWYHNRYPGARVDSDTPSYQLSLAKAYEDFNFTERFPTSGEIRRYFDHMAKELDLRKDAIFNTRVNQVTYDLASKKWNLRTDTGMRATATYLILATGTSNKVYIPDYPGWKDYKGQTVYPAAWPQDLVAEGKKIAVLGQGSSGVQIVQEIAKPELNNQVTVFIRTMPFTMPLVNRELPFDETDQDKIHYDGLFEKSKYGHFSTHPFNLPAGSWHDATEKERIERYERLFRRGSFASLSSGFWDQSRSPEALEHFYQYWRKRVHERMSDLAKKDLVAPAQLWMHISSKRPVLEMDYYEKIDQPNVKLVHLKKTPITRFASHGVVTSDGVNHDADIVISATGYDAITGSLYDMDVSDRDGVKLQEKWKNGVRTYLGMMTDKTPNAFFLYGPQAPSSFTNGPLFIEMQVDWIINTLKKAREDKVESIEPTPEAVDEYVQKVWAGYRGSPFEQGESWWVGANVPGKKKEPLLWCTGVGSWWDNCKESLKDWSHFLVTE